MNNYLGVTCGFVRMSAILICLSSCTSFGNQTTTPTKTPIILIVTPINKPGIVTADTVPVRVGPGLAFQQAATINRGQIIAVISQSMDGKWYQVEIPEYSSSQSNLWVASEFISFDTSTGLITKTEIVPVQSSTLTETIPVVGTTPLHTATFQSLPSILPANTAARPTNTLLPPAQPTNTRYLLYTPTETPIPPNTPVDTPSGTATIPTNTQILPDTPSFTPSGTATQFRIETPVDTPTAATQRALTPLPTTPPGTP